MEKLRIGILNVYMNSYPEKVMEPILEQAVNGIREKNIVVGIENCFTMTTAIYAAKQLVQKNIDAAIIFFSTWVNASVPITAIRELGNIPILLWALPMLDGISTGSLVGFSVVKPTLDRMKIKYDWVFGFPQDVEQDISQKLQMYQIKKQLSYSRIGLIGYAAMGMYTATMDHVSLKEKLGPEIVHIDNARLLEKMKNVTKEDIDKLYSELIEKRRVSLAKKELKESVERSLTMYHALQGILKEKELDSFSIKCQHEISMTIGCLCIPLSLMADEGVVCDCEGDIPGLLTLKLLYLLTGKPSFFTDVIHANDRSIYFSKCGFIPLSLVQGNITLEQQVPEIGTPGVLVSGTPVAGEVTIARLGINSDLNFQMHITTGEAQTGLKRKYQTPEGEVRSLFPFSEVRLKYPANLFLDQVQANHYVLCFSNVEKKLEDLCHFLQIKIIKDIGNN